LSASTPLRHLRGEKSACQRVRLNPVLIARWKPVQPPVALERRR
jgi:hypothetical protein